ncbi:MAG: glycosyltransferase family 4 protein [Planctomycetia bacterium]|nr:glycosyltransferase family 4 protein [Planctomycetia bacterium]
MTRVLHLTLSFSRGGRRQAISALSQGLRGLGAQSDLCCLDDLGCSPAEAAGIADAHCELRRRSGCDLRALGLLREFCRSRNVQIIHAHDAASQFTGACLRLALPRLRLLMTFHRSLDIESARWRDRLRNRWAAAFCQAIVTGTEERRRHFLQQNRVPACKVAVIPFGTDLERFHPDAEAAAQVRQELGILPSALLIGAIGHFGPEKGIDVVLQGFRALCARYGERPVVLAVLGDGTPEQRAPMLALAAALPAGHVRLLGFRSDVQRWLAGCDLLVHAPRQEAFGLVLIEAMATGLPVVATRVGGIPEIVRDGETGFLVPAEAPEALAAAMQRLCEQPELRRTFGEHGRAAALANYSLDIYARRHRELYERMLAGSPLPHFALSTAHSTDGADAVLGEARSYSWTSK